MRWTEGDSDAEPPPSFGAPSFGASSLDASPFWAAGGWLAGVCSPAPEGWACGLACPDAPPMRAMTWFGVTVSPSLARIAVSTPSVGAATSTATLSVSISTNTSSRLTLSPTFLDQFPTVPSVTDSPIVGTVTSASPPASPPLSASAGARVSETGALGCCAGLPGCGSGWDSPSGAAAAAGGALALASGAAAGLAAPFFGAGAAAPSALTSPSFWPGVTVAPSCAAISPSTPSEGEATSRLTLSVSSSTSTSSFFTGSPGFLVQRATVASLTDSPRVGVRMSLMAQEVLVLACVQAAARSGERFVQEGLEFLQVPAHHPRGGGGRGRTADIAGALGLDVHPVQRQFRPGGR